MYTLNNISQQIDFKYIIKPSRCTSISTYRMIQVRDVS